MKQKLEFGDPINSIRGLIEKNWDLRPILLKLYKLKTKV